MKILVMRFSSFGDVLQSLSIAGRLGESFPGAEIHWVTRKEFEPLIAAHPSVKKVWSLSKGAGFKELYALGTALKEQNFTHIYDAHNNLRSHVLGWILNGFLGWRVLIGQHKFLRRSIYRWRRFLLFKFHKNLFPKPFTGQFALLEPLEKWGLSSQPPLPPQLILPSAKPEKSQAWNVGQDFVALAPSAAFPLKRWPVEYWQRLIGLLPKTRFVLLGGPEDQFLAEIEKVAPDRVINLAGKLTLQESAQVVALSKALVANDTGLMHVAEQIGKPCVALMGPAPFGYPCRQLTRIMELDLDCRPCSKHGQGPCVNPEFHKCLRGIEPSLVAENLERMINA